MGLIERHCVLSRATVLKINLSTTLEQALEEELRAVERENWRNTNKKAVEKLNNLVDKNGFSQMLNEGFKKKPVIKIKD